MTTREIRKSIKASGKSVSVPQLYRHLLKLAIKPAGANQRPQQYPEDTAERIKSYLGLSNGAVVQEREHTASRLKRGGDAGCEVPARSVGIISLRQIKQAAPRRATKGTK